MCRFAAYHGPTIPLERVIVLPSHSLLDQSQNATEAKLSVNGDGFGVAWYGQDPTPGLYRDVLPAWSDGNLRDLCRMIQAPLFLAHVRASTIGATSRENCHPFRHGRWAFMHNGKIGEFRRVRRALEAMLPDDLYEARCGSTDSELLFLLLLAHGLTTDPLAAVRRTLDIISAEQGALSEPNRITCAFTDGQTIYAFRTSSDGRSPSLYLGRDMDAGGTVLASEPLEVDVARWTAVPDGQFVALNGHGVSLVPLAKGPGDGAEPRVQPTFETSFPETPIETVASPSPA